MFLPLFILAAQTFHAFSSSSADWSNAVEKGDRISSLYLRLQQHIMVTADNKGVVVKDFLFIMVPFMEPISFSLLYFEQCLCLSFSFGFLDALLHRCDFQVAQ